jgi:uncharacterized phage protein gp47/JayE
MANVYRTTAEIVAEMLEDYKNITGLELRASDLSREEVIKLYPMAGAISMLTARLQRSDDNTYPASSDEEGLVKHLKARQLPDRAEAQGSSGVIRLTGTNGRAVLAGSTQVRRLLDGKIYVAIQSGLIANGFVDITFRSLLTGSAQNIDSVNQAFQLVTPAVGVDAACTNQTQFLSGRDKETEGEMLERIEAADRNTDTGGNPTAYEGWAKASDSRVVTAKAIKNPRGPGTVDTVITSGTTDIAATVEAGLPVLRLPAPDLVVAVQALILAKSPTTDDHQTVAPTELDFNVTVSYRLYDESLRTNVDAQLGRIVKVFVYEARSGETLHPTDLERRIDENLGHLIVERRVSNFSAYPEYTVPAAKILKPGTITLTSL